MSDQAQAEPPRHPMWLRCDDGEVLVRPHTPGGEQEHCPAERLHERGQPLASPGEDLLPVRVAARVAGVTPYRVWNWLQRGLLSAHPSPLGRLVSPAAVCAVAATLGQPTERALDEYVPPFVAARQLGLQAPQVRRWVYSGQVASTPGPYGRLVRLEDVQALAAAQHSGAHPGPAAGAPPAPARAAGGDGDPQPEPDAVVLVADAVRLVGVSRTVITRWIQHGLLPAQPHAHGRRVSVAAVLSLAATVHPPCPPAEARDLPADDTAYVPVAAAARAVGVCATTVHTWARAGKVGSRPSRHGRLVRLVEVQEMAAHNKSPLSGGY